MRIDDQEEALERERHCEAAGDMIAEAIGAPAPGAPGLLADDVARVLTRRPRGKLRPAWKWAPALAVGVAVLTLMATRTQPPLRYELSGTYAARDDGFETPGNGTATARFSDGTSIAVGAHSAARVKTRTRAGATIQLERGRASFAVVHRPGARWNVEVGPFDIAVTGTEFDVHWADDRQGFEVVMKSGSVVVSGSLTGEGIPLHAGQRLVASLTNKTLAVSEVARAEAPRPQPAPAQVVAPHEDDAPRPRRGRVVAQAEPQLTLRDAPPAESPETLARMRGLTPPPFEPSTPPPAAEPAPVAPSGSVASQLGIGGQSCNERPLPQIRFEHATEGFRILAGDSAAVFRNPVIDHETSWCGGGSLRFDSSFDVDSPSGEAVVFLPHLVDLRGKTVTVRFMIRGTGDADFSARILAGQGEMRTGNTYTPQLSAGRWWTVSTTFHDQLTGFGTFESKIHQADRIILKVDATGTFRVWSGPIYIDDISWR